jgi:hypothetical protein
MTKIRFRAASLVVLTAIIACPAMAQDFSWPSQNPALATLEFDRQINDIMRSRQTPQPKPRLAPPSPNPRPKVGGAGRGQVQSSRPSATTLTFAISQQRRQSNITTFVENIAQTHAGAGNLLRQAFQQHDFFGAIETQVAPAYGMSMNNVADSTALWLAAAWFVANNDDSDLTRAQYQGLKTQIEANYLQNARLATLDSGAKQDMSDSLLLMAVWIDVSARAYKDRPIMKASHRSSIIDMARRDMGIDLTTIALTDNGFEPK